jgi:RIO kinase 1
MKVPKRIQPLIEEGLVDAVLRQLMSGKEASQRSFRQAASYQEGRKVKNSRQARAMEKGTRYGRKMQEAVWQNAEVDALYRLAAAGVRVPTP